MNRPILILRPQPGAEASARRARALGLEPVVSPLFEIAPVPWIPPDPDCFDAVLTTSANGVRCAGGALRAYLHLPCYTVGAATGAAARQAGFGDVRVGSSDGEAVARRMADERVRRALHLSGREHRPIGEPRLKIERRIVYAAEPVGGLAPEAEEALKRGAVALLHSPRAAARFAALVDAAGIPRSLLATAAISAAAAAAAGEGWKTMRSSSEPHDDALLELAAKLCEGGSSGDMGFGG